MTDNTVQIELERTKQELKDAIELIGRLNEQLVNASNALLGHDDFHRFDRWAVLGESRGFVKVIKESNRV